MKGRIDREGKLRCARCNNVLGDHLNGTVEILCHKHISGLGKCETLNTFDRQVVFQEVERLLTKRPVCDIS